MQFTVCAIWHCPRGNILIFAHSYAIYSLCHPGTVVVRFLIFSHSYAIYSCESMAFANPYAMYQSSWVHIPNSSSSSRVSDTNTHISMISVHLLYLHLIINKWHIFDDHTNVQGLVTCIAIFELYTEPYHSRSLNLLK
jgi:hypothetical protein